MTAGKFKVEVDFSHTCGVGSDPEAHLHLIKGQIVARGHNESHEFNITLGNLELVYVNVEAALDRGIPLYDFFDYQVVTEDYCTHLYDLNTEQFIPSVNRVLGYEPSQINTLILHRLKILPPHRGKKLGLASLRTAIEHYSIGCGVVVAKPYPMQLEATAIRGPEWNELRAKYQLDDFDNDAVKSTNKLATYYRALGLRKLPKSDLLILSPDKPLPSLSNLGCDVDGYYEIEYNDLKMVPNIGLQETLEDSRS